MQFWCFIDFDLLTLKIIAITFHILTFHVLRFRLNQVYKPQENNMSKLYSPFVCYNSFI